MNLADLLFGLETEYGFAVFGRAGRRCASTDADALVQIAGERHPHLFGVEPGLFLANGSRLYADAGHPELSTPECSDPREVVRYTLAGERILLAAACELKERAGADRVQLFRNNVDYASGATWGCHESYLYRSDPARMAPELIPHLASRIVYTGAGGFDNTKIGLLFRLSPRAAHLRREVGACSTHERALYHSKDEPLCAGGYHRLHVIAGESQFSQLGAFLKLGATALVVRLIEQGVCRGDAVALRSPIHALQAFAGDPTCRRRAAGRDGSLRTAVEIQRHYLQAAEAQLGHRMLPAWAEAVCRAWRQVLDQLEEDPSSLSDRLDWAIKLAVFRRRTARRGVAWESLPAWTHVLRRLKAAARLGTRVGIRDSLRARLREPLGPVIDAVEKLERHMGQHGLSWERLDDFLALRAELLEADVRFGELGARGLFEVLDAGGALAHRVDGIGDVPSAVTDPPAGGRAAARGAWIRRLQPERQHYRCRWDAIFDDRVPRTLAMGDPFGTSPVWSSRNSVWRAPRIPIAELFRRLRGEPGEPPEQEDLPF